MIRIYITILYLLFSEILFSQVVSGVVTDTTGNPVAYVSIGIVDGNRGTISNENGFYVSVEAIKGWIDSEVKRSDVIIAGAMKDGNSLIRLACLGYWENAHLLLNYYIEAEE